MESIRQDFDRDLANAASSADYEQLKVAYLGKKGRVTELFKELKNVEPSQKKEAGQLINTLRAEVEEKLAAGAEKCRQAEEERLVNEAEAYDFTRPAEAEQGSLHPITLVQREVEEIFASMGFTIEDYLEVVDEYKNFESLNIPKHHRKVLSTNHCQLTLTLAIRVMLCYFVQLRIAKVNPILLLSTCST